jgi:hypothetical protein
VAAILSSLFTACHSAAMLPGPEGLSLTNIAKIKTHPVMLSTTHVMINHRLVVLFGKGGMVSPSQVFAASASLKQSYPLTSIVFPELVSIIPVHMLMALEPNFSAMLVFTQLWYQLLQNWPHIFMTPVFFDPAAPAGLGFTKPSMSGEQCHAHMNLLALFKQPGQWPVKLLQYKLISFWTAKSSAGVQHELSE